MPETKQKFDVFQAIADPTRREILMMLSKQEMPIAAITKRFTISRTAVNKHLNVLSEADLVSRKKAGRETRYTLKPNSMSEVKEWLSYFDHYWNEKLDALRDFVESDD